MKNSTQIPNSIHQIFEHRSSPILEHRLSPTGFDTPIDLVNTIDLMTTRANSVLHALLMQFLGGAEQSRLSDSIMIGLIDSAIQEINDIESTVTAFAAIKNPR
jgi:hypothetical protein